MAVFQESPNAASTVQTQQGFWFFAPAKTEKRTDRATWPTSDTQVRQPHVRATTDSLTSDTTLTDTSRLEESGVSYSVEPDQRLRLLVSSFERLFSARQPHQIASLLENLATIATPRELLQLAVAMHACYGNDDRLRLAARLLHRQGVDSFVALKEFLARRPEFAVFFVGLASDDEVYLEPQRAQLLLTLAQIQDDDIDDRLIAASKSLSVRNAQAVLELLAGRPGVSVEAQEALVGVQGR